MPRPRIVRINSERVSLPRYLLVEAAMDAIAVTDDLTRALAAIEQRVWAGNRAAAIQELNRAAYRLEHSRGALAELAGIADSAPTEPPEAAAPIAA